MDAWSFKGYMDAWSFKGYASKNGYMLYPEDALVKNVRLARTGGSWKNITKISNNT